MLETILTQGRHLLVRHVDIAPGNSHSVLFGVTDISPLQSTEQSGLPTV